jgi:hypothetical protein
MTAAETRISHTDLSVATLSGQVLASIDGLRQELRTAMQVASLTRAGVDVEGRTPRGMSSLKLPGGVAWRGPTTVLALILVFASFLAAGAYVAGEWGPPSKSATTKSK